LEPIKDAQFREALDPQDQLLVLVDDDSDVRGFDQECCSWSEE
jgi:hypothetical protein